MENVVELMRLMGEQVSALRAEVREDFLRLQAAISEVKQVNYNDHRSVQERLRKLDAAVENWGPRLDRVEGTLEETARGLARVEKALQTTRRKVAMIYAGAGAIGMGLATLGMKLLAFYGEDITPALLRVINEVFGR
jgi:DNA repair exonuclease SbcCD ATPase subunit